MFKFLLVLGVFLSISSPSFAADFQPGELIVKYKPTAKRDFPSIKRLYDQIGVKWVRRFSEKMNRIEHLILNDPAKMRDALAALQRDPGVEYAQPNFKIRILPYRESRMKPADFPFPFPWGNGRPELRSEPAEVIPPIPDPALNKAYGMSMIGAPEAWKVFRGSKKFIVADLDTGIDYNHKDLSFNLWRNPNPTDDDIVGYDFVHQDGLPFDDNNHGTHTAGTIGAVGGNGIGISGVAQRVSLMALKFISGAGNGDTASALHAIDYAVRHGARVINASWSGVSDPGNRALRDAIENAEEHGVLVIAAAGNDGVDNDVSDQASYPAAFDLPNIISVVAVNSNDELAFFSNYGRMTTHLAAPGTDIYSTVPGDEYMRDSGTSMACPHVAGAAALLWARHPDWTYRKVKQVLLDTVDPLPSLRGRTESGGRLNIGRAMSQSE